MQLFRAGRLDAAFQMYEDLQTAAGLTEDSVVREAPDLLERGLLQLLSFDATPVDAMVLNLCDVLPHAKCRVLFVSVMHTVYFSAFSAC